MRNRYPVAADFPRRGRVYLWIIGVLVVVFGLLAGYQLWFRHRWSEDPNLMRELAQAKLPDDQPKDDQEWPQWRGPHRDGISSASGLRLEWPKEGPRILWKVEADPKNPASTLTGFSSPAVARGRLFLLVEYKDAEGSKEGVVCWDAKSGKEQWRFSHPGKYENDYGSGPRSTPTVDGDLVYAVTPRGHLFCLKAENGDKIWEHDLEKEFQAPPPRWGVAYSPLIEGDLLLTNPGGREDASIAAFDKRTGQLVWSALDDPAAYSSPVAATLAGERQVLFFTARGLVSVRPSDGKELWRFPWETSYGCNIATPIVVGDYVFISSGYGRGCAVLKVSAADGNLKVERVYEHNAMCNQFASSVYAGEHIYGFNDSVLTCMEFRTGKTVWQQKAFKKGSLIVAGGRLIILGENGKLAVAEASPNGYSEKAQWKFSTKRCWAPPALAGGLLYLRDEEKLVCVDLRSD